VSFQVCRATGPSEHGPYMHYCHAVDRFEFVLAGWQFFRWDCADSERGHCRLIQTIEFNIRKDHSHFDGEGQFIVAILDIIHKIMT